MVRQMKPQRRRSALIEEDAHLRRREGAARCVFKHGANLLEGDPGEPFDEMPYRRAIFQILEEGSDRHASSAEDPCATDAFGIALHCFA